MEEFVPFKTKSLTSKCLTCEAFLYDKADGK